MLHQVTTPSPWRSGAMLFGQPEEDSAEGAWVGVKFKEWYTHWKVGKEVQKQYKQREHHEPRKREDALPPLSVKALRKAAAAFEATMGVGESPCGLV